MIPWAVEENDHCVLHLLTITIKTSNLGIQTVVFGNILKE